MPKALGCGKPCHISKDLKHKALNGPKKTVAEISTLDTRTSAYSCCVEQASVSHTCQWHDLVFSIVFINNIKCMLFSFVLLHIGDKQSSSCEPLAIFIKNVKKTHRDLVSYFVLLKYSTDVLPNGVLGISYFLWKVICFPKPNLSHIWYVLRVNFRSCL